MWTRSELKERAKRVLRTSYWKAFLVSLILAIITGGIPSCTFNQRSNGGSSGGKSLTLPEFTGDELSGGMIALIIIVIIVVIITVLVIFAFHIFLRFPLEVGVRQYFKQAAQDDVNMNYLGFSFAKGKYVPIIKGMLWMGVLNFLWFLLLVVPGIVKAYAYSMVPYLLADNPGIGTKRAVELSNRMTRGHKWNMFVLDLSFIGWYLLGSLAFLVGILFVFPYVDSTKAELYLVLRQRALSDRICSREELGLSDTD